MARSRPTIGSEPVVPQSRWRSWALRFRDIAGHQFRQRARLPLEHAHNWLSLRPRAKRLVLLSLKVVPPARRQLLAFAERRRRRLLSMAPEIPAWTIAPSIEALEAWREIFDVKDPRAP